jgi:peptide/nickel transport system substrate-binding protein
MGALSLTVMVAVGLGACGSSSNSSGSSSSGAASTAKTGTITVLQGTAPDYLDPGLGYTTQAANADWISYTGLLTYAHAGGVEGTKLIPGVATDLGKISPDAKTYTFVLRKGLVYSNGAPVKASDFAYTIERSIKLNWGGKSFYTGNIVGAEAFDKGTTSKISGITTDDATGTITIHLTAAYGAFPNVLAFPSAALVPSGTALSNLTNNPPPGVGPYEIKNVVPNQSYSVDRNPNWAKDNIPGIPSGHVDINVKIVSNTQSEAEQVLNNSADVFDWGDTLPPALIPQIQSQAADRFTKVAAVTTYYFFLNTKVKPFNNPLAREAVNLALDRRALSRLDSGNLAPACYFLPMGMIGHPTGACPYGDPNGAPNLAKAKQLIKQAGLTGTSVTVWGQTRSPRKEFVDYYANLLNQLGFKATEKIIADAQYFPTIGNASSNPQTGFADWNQDFPNPSDFYLLMDGHTIQPQNNLNFSQVDDPHIQSELAVLNKVPTTELSKVAARWAALDEYLAKKAYVAVYGYEKDPKFFSNRIDFGAAVFHPVYGNDWTTIQLK